MPKAKSSLSKRTSDARRVQNARLRETAEQRQNRRLQTARRNLTVRAQEDTVQTELRLLQERVQIRDRRTRESSVQQSTRLQQQRERSRGNRLQNVTFLESKCAFNYNYRLNYIDFKEIQLGSMGKICSKCHAKKWKDEPPGLCCAMGKVDLPSFHEQPDMMQSLLNNTHPLSSNFLKKTRQYNTLFQMTSFGAQEVREGNYMPTFKIHGQVYHRIGSLLPQPGGAHQFLQIYFMPSDDDQVDARTNINPSLHRGLIALLQAELQDNNRLIRAFKHNLQNNELHNLKLVIHADHVPVNEHRGRYNAPTVNEIAALIVNEEKSDRDIILRSQDNKLHRVSVLHRSYDALQYPLMHFFGEDGYCINIPLKNSPTNKYVSCSQFYAFRLMIRENHNVVLHYFRNLFNQYVVDMGAKMISERLAFIRNNQKKLRADEYVHLRDAIQSDADVNVADIGQRVILPSSVTGSPRYMQEKTQDGMAYARQHGNPDLFITFTCNPNWPEIQNELFEGQRPADRHDIVSRVFNLKLKKFMHFLKNTEAFGRVKCSMATVEWQKRGLPHAHILLWLEEKIKPDDIDRIISAELPDKDVDPLLFDVVCKNMVHGPCGDLNNRSPCMKDGRCSKKFPRQFLKDTQTGVDGYPLYRRRSPEDGGFFFTREVGGRAVEIDNRWIVPYNPVLLRTFNAHINIESCHSIKSIKYVTKYINKGSDQATFSVNDTDEVSNFQNGMYLCTSQAFWRIFRFNIHDHDPPILQLAVHLENNQRVYFTTETANNILLNPPKTTLTAFFDLCSRDDFAKTLLYHEVHAYFTWQTSRKVFQRRLKGQDVEGYPGIKRTSAMARVYTVHPSQSECFHLRLLLHHVRGPTSYGFLKAIDGDLHPTFKSACQALGLLEDDNQWKHTLADAALSQSSEKMRDLFAIILGFCYPSEPSVLWETFKNDFCEDILHRKRLQTNNFDLTFSDEIFNEGLILLEKKVLALFDKRLTDFSLPQPIEDERALNESSSTFENGYDIGELQNYVSDNLIKLVSDQRQAFEKITASVEKNLPHVFFLDAPGGTGKTWLINLLLAYVRSKGSVAIGVASSGIAATLLSGGRTAHSTFKLRLNVNCHEEFYCNIRKNGPLADLLKKTKLIVWDECTMSHRAHFEALDRTLRDIRSTNKRMGGIAFVFAGDFRQTLPVIPKGTRADIVKACLKSSELWHEIETLPLRTNMRAHLGGSNSDFPAQLLKIGEGTYPNEDGYITIDDKIGKIVRSVDALISSVYPDIENLVQKPYTWLCERAILTTLNSSADELNDLILDMIPGTLKEYLALDSVPAAEATNFPTEFLNSLNPPGFPRYKLRLKIGAPIMLLRNLNPPRLCNGTRLQITALRNNIIEATILTGPAAGELAFIPRIPLISSDSTIEFKRMQFPIRVSFAVTINKSQGQTLSCVGVDLREDCFSHGQPYVAFSRTGNPVNQFILLPASDKTKNIVYSEIL